MRKRGQLFIIEVIISVSVLLILVTTLFATQNFSKPVQTSNLSDRGDIAIQTLVESGDMFEYLLGANSSYYSITTGDIWDEMNQTKIDVKETIEAALPVIASFKVFTDRYNPNLSTPQWEQIDIINFQTSLPTGYDITVVEYYSPGFNGVYDQFKFKLFIWYEVDV